MRTRSSLTPKSSAALATQFGREIFGAIKLSPVATQLERRTHHRSAAAIKPFVLLMRSRQAGFIHQRDFPFEIDVFVFVTLLQFRPCRLGPVTPRRNNIDIVGRFDSHR